MTAAERTRIVKRVLPRDVVGVRTTRDTIGGGEVLVTRIPVPELRSAPHREVLRLRGTMQAALRGLGVTGAIVICRTVWQADGYLQVVAR